MLPVRLALILAVFATPALAQRAAAVVRVRVVDTTGKPVADADVSIRRGMNTVLATGATDSAGVRRLLVPRSDDELELIVRRLGYQRGDHLFRADHDTVALVVRLRATPQELAAVQITASQDPSRKRYHVTADDIAASSRRINDGLDVVTKLRPDMMEPPGQGIFTRCGLYDVWINGERIVFPPIDPALAIRTSQQRQAARAAANPTAGRPPHFIGTATVPVTVQSVLAKIRPEHIEEMNYVDCRDSHSTDMPHGQNAVFVVLKPGVAYDQVRGTYVTAGADRAALDVLDAPVVSPRVLGAFDESTGKPIVDAQVVDVATGTFARTTTTGTVTLGFLREGRWMLEIRREGYASARLEVAISPRDTVPLTLVLTPRP